MIDYYAVLNLDPQAPWNQPDPDVWTCPGCNAEFDAEQAEIASGICEDCDEFVVHDVSERAYPDEMAWRSEAPGSDRE